MDSYILYGDHRSGSSTVEMALAEIGAPFELRAVPLEGDHQLAAEYLAINPMGRVPALILPDGMVLTESLAILLTLADRHPEANLLPPPGDAGRAVALRWMTLAAAEFYPHVTRSDYPARFLPNATPAETAAIRARANEMGRDIWTLVETHAAPAPFILGERFSVADIYLSVLTRWMNGDEWIPAHCPRLEALAQAVAARPKAGPVWLKHFGKDAKG
jgi:GST-like protein